ncbi:hypothetical protein DCC39_14610 [Pueribacillus theae]|uniref:Uncharacterized protein n=1 Tax=Pueribacillus theae TaxID=2171751 RepID=A0A2U1JTZ1_9BACI|nr:hypothetical protein [Pueribacillus theae]PWA08667.1 hypothetical protein DCC39_14610 [Pueribacillus theae]
MSIPGPQNLIAGDMQAGFFGEVPASELINGQGLSNLIGLSAGVLQHSNEPWLKFAYEGKIQFVAKKTFRYNLSWDELNLVGVVYGNNTIVIDGLSYKVRLMKGANSDPANGSSGEINHYSEWNRLMLPILSDAPFHNLNNVEDDLPVWNHGYGTGTDGRYTGIDIPDSPQREDGYGSESWCQEKVVGTNNIISRGGSGLARSRSLSSAYKSPTFGWRPVLELMSLPEDASLIEATDAVANLVSFLQEKKNKIGSAITGVDDSVVLPTDPTFQQLANAIGQISIGKKWARGIMPDTPSKTAEVIGLDFSPSIIVARSDYRAGYARMEGVLSVYWLENSLNVQIYNYSNTWWVIQNVFSRLGDGFSLNRFKAGTETIQTPWVAFE